MSATDILQCLRDLQDRADKYEECAASWHVSPEELGRASERLEQAWARFAELARGA